LKEMPSIRMRLVRYELRGLPHCLHGIIQFGKGI
jgi:hypothetical protein